MQPPAQELGARDLHDSSWTFRHIYRGMDPFSTFILSLCPSHFVCLYIIYYCFLLDPLFQMKNLH